MAYHQMQNCLQMRHLFFRLCTMLTLLQMNLIMIFIKSIYGLSNGKWVLTQTQANRSKKLFLAEKLRKFAILRYVLITALSRNLHIKSILAYFLMLDYNKVNKTIGLLRKLQKILPRPVLMTMYKALLDRI